ncbi:DUF4381 domain-containing protein [Aeromonas jandaei]|uniref:DUF4381 domain-containing protein n=1 Tax=Aeromonas jandaei TaxID=650 RepID=UPI001F4853AE|nr:DUF4381 domain-containing protein [Aeromonas jandaei]MCF7717081.1 DUF4381 domain-containing protein [Aeromonas jandaei]
MSSGIAPLLTSSPASEAITTPLNALLKDKIRDIHPGPEVGEQLLDPRLQALLWLLILVLLLVLIIRLAMRVQQYRRWCRQLEGAPQLLVNRIQDNLRQEALHRWPESRLLQGEEWLAFLDRQGSTRFSQFAHNWNSWLYGNQAPDHEQSEQLKQNYYHWGRAYFLYKPRLASKSRTRGNR